MLVGLPGCGKTRYMERLGEEGWCVFDDFKAAAINDSPRFDRSRHFEDLLASLRAGHRCAIADIDFCKGQSRTEAEIVLRAAIPNVDLRWCFFAHDERSCEDNIRRRNRDSLEADLRKLRDYSRIYSVPDGVRVRPVTE